MAKKIDQLSLEQIRQVQWLLTDVDDTLTWEGKLPSETLLALERLQNAGIKVIAVTGASAGWCDHMSRAWPLHSVIGENGAFWMQKTSQGFQCDSYQSIDQMQHSQKQLVKAITGLLSDYPDIELSADQHYRLCDVAVNISQDRAPVDLAIAQEITSKIRQLTIDGKPVNAMLSSIHINAWVGSHSKYTTSTYLLDTLSDGHPLNLETICYIGDSQNDEEMFRWLPITVGVNNILSVMDQLTFTPKFITSEKGGYGFCELAARLLQAHNVTS